jgi:protein-S-isoprenylcysteine O-methyltransferase Ste14
MTMAYRKYWFPKPYADTVARLRVPSGFLLVVMFIWLAAPTMRSLLWGVPLSCVGLVIRAWAAGHLAKNKTLATAGPYAFVRNPLYVGTLFVAAGISLAAQRLELCLLFAAVFVFVYLPVIELEEQHLRKLFPEYKEYAERVGMLLPTGEVLDEEQKFDPKLYRQNEEYKALLGYMIAFAVLVWKTIRP